MQNTIKKIILIDFSEKQFEVLSKVLEQHELFSDQLSEEIFATIDAEDPQALIVHFESHNYNKKILNKLINLCLNKKIPLSFITTSLSHRELIDLIQHKICNIITIPIFREDFIPKLDRYLNYSKDCNSPQGDEYTIKLFLDEDTVDVNLDSKGINVLINSLLGSLDNQIRFSKIAPEEKNKSKKEEYNSTFSPEEQQVEKILWESLEENHFVLHYQPVISLLDDKLFGFEALIRINHPEKGIIPPMEFIDVAEKSEIIYPLGLWIVETACKQIFDWKKKFNLTSPIKINTNLSPRQFLHQGLADDLIEITEKYETNHEDIGFELTESTFMEDRERANISLLQLKSKNFSIYMDDFGTGYSSISYLMHFPVNVLKIDQSFIKWMNIDEQSETIVKSIINMAHSLGLKVVAEGTEEKEHIEILKDLRCDYAQGYYYSKPLPPEEAEKYIAKYFKEKDNL